MTRPLTGPERQRLRSVSNMWRALIPLVVLVVVAVIVVWPRGTSSDGVHVVDVAGPIAAAKQQAGLAVLTPTGLGAQWRPTSAALHLADSSGPASLRIGYVSPTGGYAELLQSADSPDAVGALYGPLAAAGPVSVAGVSWTSYRTENGRLLLRHTLNGNTVIVTGSASQAELTQLAASLTA